MTVDEEFLEYWMTGSNDEHDESSYDNDDVMMADDNSVCSDIDDIQAMLVEDEVFPHTYTYNHSTYHTQQQQQQYKSHPLVESGPQSVGWEFGF